MRHPPFFVNFEKHGSGSCYRVTEARALACRLIRLTADRARTFCSVQALLYLRQQKSVLVVLFSFDATVGRLLVSNTDDQGKCAQAH